MKFRKLLFISLLLCSCNGKNEEKKIPLFSFLDRSDQELCYLDKQEFDSLKEKKASLVLYVYQGSCSSCDAFGYILKDYVKEYQDILFTMNLDIYSKTKDSLSISESSLLFLKNGKYIDYTSDFSSIGSKKELHSYLERYVSFTGTKVANETRQIDSDTPFNTFVFTDSTSLKIMKDKGYLFLFDSFQDYCIIDVLLKEQKIDYLLLPLKDYSQFSSLQLEFSSYQYILTK